ncbi:MAG: hypothetical protein C4539_14700 [Ignavibacteriales bacterium]|nr:MAG: hypothetical protein C4539_14700 [Ignavibacteriales bacterium]
MEIDFNVDQLVNQVYVVFNNKYKQAELNEIIESCFKISYSLLTSASFISLNLALSEEEKFTLCARSISPLFNHRKENSQINLNMEIQSRLKSNYNSNELFFALFDIIKERTMKELNVLREPSYNYC